ncbi:MAG TPA: DUF6797 domain-containing protein, partial [Pirellulaceae bacterium]|nr:DUF6797 domain-containing protein [Pirellulaceae bacterium]
LEPSKFIQKGYETHTVVTTDGRTLQGLIVSDAADALTLREPLPPGKTTRIPQAEIEERTVTKASSMPAGQIEQLTSRQQFLDLLRYLFELRTGGARRARELQPDPALIAVPELPEYEKHLDHAGLVRTWNQDSFQRGEAIYLRVCANCHGTHDRPGSLPQSLRFAEGKFKNGSDPLAMYQTLTRGFGFMMPQHWMVPRQKYDVIHYIREAYLKTHNPAQHTTVDAAYLARLPRGDTLGPAARKIEPWVTMDYGPSLMNTYEIAPGNLAFKAIAMRLDSGPGGVSRGQQWAAFDHDTLRMAGLWRGAGFIDWNGIHFNGQHQIHPKIVGSLVMSNPVGPGWAHPVSGSLQDPRPLARDGRPYGPLPREWARFRGYYAHGARTVVSYQVGAADVLESPDLIEIVSKAQPANYAYARQFQMGPRERPLTLVVATEPNKALQGPLPGVKFVSQSAAAKEASEPRDATLTFKGQTHIEVAKPADFDLTGESYSILARLRTRGDGTILSQAASQGPWVPNAKSLFIRGGKLVFDIGWVGAVTSKGRIDDGKWHVVAMTWQRDKGRTRLYIDGRLDGEGQLQPNAPTKDFSLRLGYSASNFPAVSAFTGEMSVVAFHQTQLTEEAIAAAAKAKDILKIAEKPIAAWDLRSSKDRRVADLTGGGHDGAVVTENAAEQSGAGPLMAGMHPNLPESRWRWDDAGRLLLDIPAGQEPLAFTVWLSKATNDRATDTECAAVSNALASAKPLALDSFTRGGPSRWPQILTTQVKLGAEQGPFAVDLLTPPDNNPWLAQLRLSGVDFFPDGDRAAVCSWDGDVWLVSGLSKLSQQLPAQPELRWQRVATGLFQPLGIKIIAEKMLVTCRDQIVRLHDLNGDQEIDYHECFNNDHQVTEHFHEFAMGLQADDAGNLYYAKSARHALPALVPHHGTLLRVSADGRRTDILANGFRAANGVCMNPDGSFIVTDQEGHWNPKNRINWVTVDPQGPPKFYGNMFGYHDRTDSSDSAMEPPLCWITNAFDRSPAELLWVTSDRWGPLKGSLLNLSYGNGKVFLVPHERVNGQVQGGMIELPVPAFPTGVMRGRFHP